MREITDANDFLNTILLAEEDSITIVQRIVHPESFAPSIVVEDKLGNQYYYRVELAIDTLEWLKTKALKKEETL